MMGCCIRKRHASALENLRALPVSVVCLIGCPRGKPVRLVACLSPKPDTCGAARTCVLASELWHVRVMMPPWPAAKMLGGVQSDRRRQPHADCSAPHRAV